MEVEALKIVQKSQNHRDRIFFKEIDELDESLYKYFSDKIIVDYDLTRKLVSFQGNRSRAYYQWYKYKEAFSADLVEYLFRKYDVKKGKILDPFAGAGTALFAASTLGYDSDGIEVLPVGQKIISANILARGKNKQKIISCLEKWLYQKPWNENGETKNFQVLRITDGAYSSDTHYKISRYLNEIEFEAFENREILLFALLCILESISYTRKDGQYLRWDYRSRSRNGKNTFDKGEVLSFDDAIIKKLCEVKNDMSFDQKESDLFSNLYEEVKNGDVSLLEGSCLEVLPNLDNCVYTGVITSPPYCNRYDYTRTYALEHAMIGVTENELIALRQEMLSCTVENKSKEIIEFNKEWQTVIEICNNMPLLQKILYYLDYKKGKNELNNSGISRMVRGYFYEMSCIIHECHRLLEKGGIMLMVNDNVRYAGVAISVDTILSKIAESIGFRIENILVLPQGKGNSSQQMGKHGREVLRKCIYVWKKG